jgi:pilus assembly protein CpaC
MMSPMKVMPLLLTAIALLSTQAQGADKVNIRLRFLEVSRNDLPALGFKWEVVGGDGGVRLGKSAVDTDIADRIRNGALTNLAEPTLTAVAGETAKFHVGGEVPVPVCQPSGPMTVQYRTHGLFLDFTPTIIDANRIALHVRPEVSTMARGEMPTSCIKLPVLLPNDADLTVEATSGQTFAITGISVRQLMQDFDEIPGSDAPVLGTLFKSEKFRRNESELVLLITPYLSNMAAPRTATGAIRTCISPPAEKRHDRQHGNRSREWRRSLSRVAGSGCLKNGERAS